MKPPDRIRLRERKKTIKKHLKKVGGMRKFSIFAMNSIHKGERTHFSIAGFFHACRRKIYGSVPPCGVLIHPLPLWWNSTGKAEPFFFAYNKHFICNEFHRKSLFARENYTLVHRPPRHGRTSSPTFFKSPFNPFKPQLLCIRYMVIR
jgi:hypothetical protein